MASRNNAYARLAFQKESGHCHVLAFYFPERLKLKKKERERKKKKADLLLVLRTCTFIMCLDINLARTSFDPVISIHHRLLGQNYNLKS